MPTISRNMEYRPGNRGLQIKNPGGRKIDAAGAIRGKIIRPNERFSRVVVLNRAELFAVLIQLNDAVRVIACNQKMVIAKLDESSRATVIFLPIGDRALAVPHSHAALSGVFHVEKPSLLPERSVGHRNLDQFRDGVAPG